jgi:hypothetical protein
VTAQHTPNLVRLIKKGVRFLNHHAVFPTETRVNVASFVTGRNPGFHGIVDNTFRVYDRGTPREVNTGKRQCLAQLDEESGGRLLLAKSLGEILAEHGKKMIAVGVGSDGNAFLHNHKAEETRGLVIHSEFAIPAEEEEEIARRVGAWPPAGIPNTGRIHHAARARASISSSSILGNLMTDLVLVPSQRPVNNDPERILNAGLGLISSNPCPRPDLKWTQAEPML